jgi:uncharacterized membrane protein YkoI
MKKFMVRTAMVFSLVAANAFGENGVEKISWSQLPTKVQKVAHAHITRHGPAQKSTEDGEVFYDVGGMKNGKHVELSANADGKILSLEQEVDLAKTPEAVQAGVKKTSANGKVGKVQKVTEDAEVSFVADISEGTKNYSLEFNPTGELQSRTEEIPWAQIPPAAQKTLKGEIAQNEVESFTKVTEDNEVSFSAQIIKGGKEREISVSPEGELVAFEFSLSETPMAVQKVIKERVGAGKVDEINKTSDGGKIFYDVEFSKDGNSHFISVNVNGNIASEEEEVSLLKVPAVAQKAIQSALNGRSAETITKRTEDGEVFYDVTISKKGANEEFSVSPAGEVFKDE